jgi:hypothetical protein
MTFQPIGLFLFPSVFRTWFPSLDGIFGLACLTATVLPVTIRFICSVYYVCPVCFASLLA